MLCNAQFNLKIEMSLSFLNIYLKITNAKSYGIHKQAEKKKTGFPKPCALNKQ